MNNTRLCGAGREKSGVYFEVATSPDGLPLESFLLCPPIVIGPKELGISPIGMSLLPRQKEDGSIVYHVADWIGESHYPDIWDFLSEGNALNFSRRVPSTFDFSKLSKESRIYFIHARGWISNWQEYYEHEPDFAAAPLCPHDQAASVMARRNVSRNHININSHSYLHKEFCSRLWKQDLTESSQTTAILIQQAHKDEEVSHRYVQKKLPCDARYEGFLRPLQVVPQYRVAIIGSFPLGRIAVVKSEDGTHAKKAEKARKQTAIEVVEVDE